MSPVPTGLTEQKGWLVWKLLDGRKPPVDDDAHPERDWQLREDTYEVAQRRLSMLPVDPAPPGQHPSCGLGLIHATGADLDDCVVNGALIPSAARVLSKLPGYAEWSPSGKGVKVFFRVNPPGWLELNFHGGASDVTCERKSPLYFAVTGNAVPNRADSDPEQDGTEALAALEKFFSPAPSLHTETGHKSKPLPEEVRPGSQNQEAFREACRYARMGKSEEEIAGMLWAQRARFPTETGREPWSEQDFRVIARSAGRYRPAEDAFPLDNRGDGSHFVSRHSDVVRFDHRRGRWLVFDGNRWEPDPTEKLREFAEQSQRSRRLAAAAIEDKASRNHAIAWTGLGSNTHRIDCVLRESRSMPPIASGGTEWDVNPLLLGVKNGVVDLSTGQLRQGRPEDMITMQTACEYDVDARSQLWEDTVTDVFKDKPDEFIAYVQRALGYSITGLMREEVFFLLTGVGRNGKGTIVNTLHKVLGDYSADLKFSSLEQARHGNGGAGPTPDLVKLENKRFVIASEGSGGALNTGLVKQITGRDPLSARAMYKDELTFEPQLKLWLSAQSDKRPKVRDDSEGFWARPHEIQFKQSYRERPDLTLKDRLFPGESIGILAWVVRGAIAWLRDGLKAPSIVTTAVEEYRRSQEPLAEFYEACCLVRPGLRVATSDIRNAYVRWCEVERIHFRLGSKRFSQEVGKRFEAVKLSRDVRGYDGIGLLEERETREPGQDDVPF